MPEWSPFQNSRPLTANEIGRQAMPRIQRSVAPVVGQEPPERTVRMTRDPAIGVPGRPAANIGKMSVNLGSPLNEMADNAERTGGFVEGLGAGAGRWLGSFAGPEAAQTGADIGQTLGRIAQLPLDAAGNVLGALPSIPFLPGGSIPGANLLQMSEEERQAAIDGWDRNPFTLFKHLSDIDKQKYGERVQSGEVSGLLADMGPSSSLGDQFMYMLSLMDVPQRAVQRTIAGVSRPEDVLQDESMAELERDNPAVHALALRYKSKEITRDQFLDELVMNNAGYGNNWLFNLGASMLLDPLLLVGGAAGKAGQLASKAKIAKSLNFTKSLSKEAIDALDVAVKSRAAREGIDLANLPDGQFGRLLMEEAENAGLHGAELAAAKEQLTRSQQFWDQASIMEPIWKTAQAVADPLTMIGRRGTKPLQQAWLSREATRGVVNYYGTGNVSRLQQELGALGQRGAFDEALGRFAAQEGMFLEGELLGRDVMATRQIVDERPTTVARSRTPHAGAQNYAAQMERQVQRHAEDVAMPTGMGTAKDAHAAAVEAAAQKLVRGFGITEENARRITGGLDAKGLSLIDAAYFGLRSKRFNAAKKAAQEAMDSTVATGKAAKRYDKVKPIFNRLTLIGPRELTTQRAEALRSALDGPTADAANAGRAAIRSYDRLWQQFLADGPTDEEIVAGLKAWLDGPAGKGLTSEVDPDAIAKMPKVIGDDITDDGYRYGLRPEGEAEWRIETTTNADGELVVTNVNPWIDIVGDVAQPWSLKFDGNGLIQTKLGALERAVLGMTNQITTDRIFAEARRDFTTRLMDGAFPDMKTGVTYGEAKAIWQQVLKTAKEQNTTPRGMSLETFDDIVKANPAAMDSGLSGRDLMGATLNAFEGRLSTVGVTQKLTGQLKTTSASWLPGNALGAMSERMYPMVRFGMNPFFQLQEWVEPWVFAAARERTARLRGAKVWTDPVTGELVSADDLYRQQNHLITRYKAANPYAEFDMMERSMAYIYGSKAAKGVQQGLTPSRIAEAQSVIRNATNVATRKQAAQSTMFRTFLGPMLKEKFDAINPRIWLDLEMEYGTIDKGEIAVRWLIEKDYWASADPNVATLASSALKGKYVGATSPVDLDNAAKHIFKTDRGAMTIAVRDGTLDQATFSQTMRDFGAHEDYIERAWKNAQFDAKTGGVDQFWEDSVKVTPGGKKNVKAVRTLVQGLADGAGVSEGELLSRSLMQSPTTMLQDDLIAMVEGDYDAWDVLFQRARYAQDYFWNDPKTGARVPRRPRDSAIYYGGEEGAPTRITQQEAEARFLESAKNPPSDMPADQIGDVANMENVMFGLGGRTVFIPGGLNALADLEKPFTVWESHVIRSQMIDPMELNDPVLKHALYEKMWRAHTIDMADPDGVWRTYNNTVMAMTSAGLNLTRNELIATRFRVGSMDELMALADDAKQLRESILRGEGPDYEVTEGDLGFAYGTNRDVMHYIPLDARDDYLKEGSLPERIGPDGKKIRSTRALIEERATVASSYLNGASAADIVRHESLPDLYAALPKYAGKNKKNIPGQVSEWAVDRAVDLIRSPRGIDAIDDLRLIPGMLFVRSAKIANDPDTVAAVLEAAGKLAEDPMDLAARDVIRAAVVPKMKTFDGEIAFKKWNVNKAGRPYFKASDGSVTHGDKSRFAYLKNDDVSWRGFSTNGAMGTSLMMAEDFVNDPGFYARRVNEPAVLDPNAYLDEINRIDEDFEDALNEGRLDKAADYEAAVEAKNTARKALVEKHGISTGRRAPVWGQSHGNSGAMTGEAAAIMGIDGYRRPDDLLPSVAAATERYLEGIAESPGSAMPLFSGQRVEGRPLPAVGSVVDLPLVATTPSRSMAEGFSRSMDYRNKMPGYVVEFAPGTKATYHASDEFLTAGRFEVSEIVDVPHDEFYGLTGHPDAPPVKVVRMKQSEAFDPATKSYQPVAPRAPVQEPLDEFAERMANRTNGLSLKTSYFGIDLGDPMAFNRGVMDTHMVGDLTEWMYYEVTNKGTDPRWQQFVDSLSPAKRTQVNDWLARDWKNVPDPSDPTGKKVMKAPLDPADRPPRGAGTFDWSEATGLPYAFKTSGKDKAGLDAAKANGDHATVAAWVRKKIEASVADPKSQITAVERDRWYRMYRTDEELADLYGRSVKVLGGDYAIYDNLMTERKAAEAATDPLLARHGNGGYQWKLWDDRRHVWDPESSVFAASHTMPRRSVKYMAASDDAHFAAGFMDKGGLRPITEAGYRYLDPGISIMAQADSDVIRGATIWTKKNGPAIIKLTESADRSTFLHEINHAVTWALMDPSGRRAIVDDLNEAIARRNEDLITSAAEAKTRLDALVPEVNDLAVKSQVATKDAAEAAKSATQKATEATKAAKVAQESATALATQRGVLKATEAAAPGRIKAIKAQGLTPSVEKRRLDAVTNGVAREQAKLEALRIKANDAADALPVAKADADAAAASAKSLKEDADLINAHYRDMKRQGEAARKEYDDLATRDLEETAYDGDVSVEEHFISQFEVWLSTGKAPNPKMRDAFAYFRKVLTRIRDFIRENPEAKVSPQVQSVFEDLFKVPAKGDANVVPFDATQEVMHAAGRQSVADAEDAAFANVQFRRGRSWVERSVNHPYFGIYPASYMWGKVLPEMIRGLALHPFGMPIPGFTGAMEAFGKQTDGLLAPPPGLGYVNSQRVWNAVELQKDNDPAFNEAMNDPANDKFFRSMGMLLPATPWDIPANFPLWLRRFSEWGMESQIRVEEGKKPKGYDPLAVAGEVAGYTFGPAATLDWMSDMARLPKAPVVDDIFNPQSEEDAVGQFVVTPEGGELTVEQALQRTGVQLQGTFGQ